jgi:MoaA/NifB/PqqE/SkfB family radical SAM enzyme
MPKPKVEIWFELETRCNLRCRFCYNFWRGGAIAEPARMDMQQIRRALENLFAVAQCERVAISGGEPLLNENLHDLLSLLQTHGIPVILTTNGTLLDREKIRRLKQEGVVTFQIPFHSTDAATHDWICGAPCFPATLQALRMLREEDANVVPVFVATTANLDYFTKVMKICAVLGIGEIIFNRFVPSGLGLQHRDELGVPDDDMLFRVLTEADQLAREHGLSISLGTPIPLPIELRRRLDHVDVSSCPVEPGQSRWTIGSDGSIRRCNHSSLAVGNLLKDGARVLIEEIRSVGAARPVRDEIVPCQILQPERFVQIRVN